MSYTAKQLIAIAEAEVGYLEKASNANLDSKAENAGYNNYTKYARDLAAAGYYQASKNGYEWCEVFNDWCHWIASGKDAKLAQEVIFQTDLYGAGCMWSARCYRNAGRFFSTPKVGDQIYFGKAGDESHTGIVYKVDSNNVYTIEGNTSGASGVIANGGGVCKKSYSLGYAKIVGYGRPAYAEDESEDKPEVKPTNTNKEVFSMELRYLRKGSKGKDVKALQTLLKGYGYSVGRYGADGDFGSATEAAVKKFQAAEKIAADGIVGPDTWTHLLK